MIRGVLVLRVGALLLMSAWWCWQVFQVEREEGEARHGRP